MGYRQLSDIRVYEYVLEDGTVVWSFTKSPNLVTPPQRMSLQNKHGLLLSSFIGGLRKEGMALLRGAEEDDVG